MIKILIKSAVYTPIKFNHLSNKARFSHDEGQVESLLSQITEPIEHFSADGAYDKTPVYNAVIEHSPQADVVIPPSSNAVVKTKAAEFRNRNIHEIKEHGRMQRQKNREYDRRNYSERGVQRYQKILGDALHAPHHPTCLISDTKLYF